MPLPPVPATAQLRARFVSASGLNAINVFHVRDLTEPAWTAAGLEEAADLLATIWGTELGPQIDNEVFLGDITATSLHTLDSPQITKNYNTAGTSAAPAGSLLPFQTACLINWQTESRGRSARGKSYLVGFTEPQSSGGQCGQPVIGAAQSFGADLISEFANNGRELVVVSYFTGGDANADPPTPTTQRVDPVVFPIVRAKVDFNWKTQRRRALAG